LLVGADELEEDADFVFDVGEEWMV